MKKQYIQPLSESFEFQNENEILSGSVLLKDSLGDDEEYTRKRGWTIPEDDSEPKGYWD